MSVVKSPMRLREPKISITLISARPKPAKLGSKGKGDMTRP
jgi:hypothetical protein